MLLLANFFLEPGSDFHTGLVLYGLAPCIAMVIIFTFLSFGNTAMFALKGDLIVARPGIILELAIPMTLFFWSIFVVVYLAGWKLGFNYEDATAVAFNSTGRDFEIAIAIAITAFNPTVALATVIGPLIEVPVMLVLV